MKEKGNGGNEDKIFCYCIRCNIKLIKERVIHGEIEERDCICPQCS